MRISPFGVAEVQPRTAIHSVCVPIITPFMVAQLTSRASDVNGAGKLQHENVLVGLRSKTSLGLVVPTKVPTVADVINGVESILLLCL